MVSREATISFEEGIDRNVEYQRRMKMALLQHPVGSGLLLVPSQELPSKPNPARRKRKAVHGEPHEPVPKGNRGLSLLLQGELLDWQAPPLQIPQTSMPLQNQNPSPQWPKNPQPCTQMKPSVYQTKDQQPSQRQYQGQPYYQQQHSKAALVWCNLCKLNCVTLHNLKIHMQGKKHKAKLDKQSPKGEHKAKHDGLSLQVNCVDNQLQPEAQPVLAWCNVCEVNCKNHQNLKRHLQGRKHKAKWDKQSPTVESMDVSSEPYQEVKYSEEQLREIQASPEWCTLCKVNCMNLQNLKRHLQGKRHREKWNEQPLRACYPGSQ